MCHLNLRFGEANCFVEQFHGSIQVAALNFYGAQRLICKFTPAKWERRCKYKPRTSLSGQQNKRTRPMWICVKWKRYLSSTLIAWLMSRDASSASCFHCNTNSLQNSENRFVSACCAIKFRELFWGCAARSFESPCRCCRRHRRTPSLPGHPHR